MAFCVKELLIQCKQAWLVWGQGPINTGWIELGVGDAGGSWTKHGIEGLSVT